MNSWEDAHWRGGRAGGFSRRSLEGDPVKGSSSKSVRVPPPLRGLADGLAPPHQGCHLDWQVLTLIGLNHSIVWNQKL